MNLYNARFLRRREIRRVLKRRNPGITLDGRRSLSLAHSFVHTMITAGSGMGKSSTVLIPTLLRMQPNAGSAVVTDPSGELAEKTAHYLRKEGFEVQCLNILSPDHSVQFNPLSGITTEAEVAEIADVIIQTVYGKSTGNATFWNESASSLLSVILAMLLPEPDHFNLANARYLLNIFGASGEGVASLAAKNLSPKMEAEFIGLISKEEKVLTSVIATATAALKIYGNDTIAQVSSGHSFDVDQLRRRPTVLFLQCPEDKLNAYAPYLALVYHRILSGPAMEIRPPNHTGPWLPIHFLLDEFGNTFIPGFPSYVTTLRKRKCSLTILLQDPAQLDVYGRDGGRTIISNMYNKLWMGGLDIRTCQLVEQTIGRTIKQIEKKGNAKESVRALMTADEIRIMPRGRALFVQNDRLPAKLKLRPYFKSWRMRMRVKQGPMPHDDSQDKTPEPWNGFIEVPPIQGPPQRTDKPKIDIT